MVFVFIGNMHAGILASLCWQIALLAVSCSAYPFDSRKLNGLNPWLKPIKFQISSVIFLLTMAILLYQLREIYQASEAGHGWPSVANTVGWTMGLAMIVENLLIAFQASRGVQSHMNFSTPFDTGVFRLMGISILFITLAIAALLLLYLDPSPQWRWPAAVNAGARLGLAILMWGSLEGVSMVNRQQHLVGKTDDTDGIPLLNWSRTHGDLRVAHFFGIHAIQILLLLGFLLSCTSLAQVSQVAILSVFAALYMGACHLLFRRALQGRPFPG